MGQITITNNLLRIYNYDKNMWTAETPVRLNNNHQLINSELSKLVAYVYEFRSISYREWHKTFWTNELYYTEHYRVEIDTDKGIFSIPDFHPIVLSEFFLPVDIIISKLILQY